MARLLLIGFSEVIVQLNTEIIIAAPASEAWKVLGQHFGAIGEWAAAIHRSKLDRDVGVGAMRTCEIGGFGPFANGEIVERLTHFDPETMSFGYVVSTGLPGFIESAENRWSIEALGPERCRVLSRATIVLRWWVRPVGPLMGWRMRADSQKFKEELEHRVEHGQAHPRKVRALARHAA